MGTKETSISDDILNQAAMGATGETEPEATPITETEQAVKSEETVSETKVEEKHEEVRREGESDQQFRSRLGKRVSRMEDNFSSFMEEIRSEIKNLRTAPSSDNQFTASADGSGSYISTEDDVKRVIQKYESERVNATAQYQNNYLDRLARMGMEEGLNDVEFVRLEELTKNSPLTYRDASIDAERNFLRAIRVIEKERLTKGTKLNLKGDTPVATGVASGAEMIDKKAAPIKLDKWAQEFVDYHKVPEEKIKKALG